MPTYKTPDVYVEEIPVFPPSVAEVETAIPAFIGYTKTAMRTEPGDLKLSPTKIYSMTEYEQYFGGPFPEAINIKVGTNDDGSFKVESFKIGDVVPDKSFLPRYLLYYAVKLYFDNGGGKCYIVSVGDYSKAIDDKDLLGGLAALNLEDEPTLIVIPDAVKLKRDKYGSVVQEALKQCGVLRDRFGIFDVFDGGKDLNEKEGPKSLLDINRDVVATSNLKYGALYYPFIRTSLNYFVPEDKSTVAVTLPPAGGAGGAGGGGGAAPPAPPKLKDLETNDTAVYNFVRAALEDRYIVMPPSGAVAGVYAATDTARGVWKAPANVSLADVIEPVVKLDNAHQDDLNVDPNSGKSINAIRYFAGKGTLVWGARTLAGNDNEWRYISVRRFFNMVEESVKKSTYWAVFEPNDANTWVKVRGMIENYLTQKWREGALAGATTKDAFFVRCGLGTTMSAQDILEGRMNVEIGMAVVRPAEFIILKFSHKLQVS